VNARQTDVDAICKPQPNKPLRKGSRAKSQISPDREGTPSGRKRAGSPGREKTPEGSSTWPAIGPVFAGGPYAPGRRRSSIRQGAQPALKNPHQRQLWDTWKNTWGLAWERQRRLQDKLNYCQEMDKLQNFDFEEWRIRFMKYANQKKMRITDLFRRMDTDNDGFVTKEEFSEGIIKTHMPTSALEMRLVSDKVDKNQDGLIDYNEFMSALRPDWEKNRPMTESEVIHDEVQRACEACNCRSKFKVFQVGEGKYRFGDSQKLRLVRILRSTVMVRVGGGWEALDEFLVKNDPCRAKGRTNVELREQFILAPGVSQSMTPFKNRGASPSNRSTSVPTAGPITKVREKTGRSIPLSRASVSGASGDHAGFTGPGDSQFRPADTQFRLRKESSTPLRQRVGSEASLDSADTPGSARPRSARKGSTTPHGKTSSPSHEASNGADSTPQHRSKTSSIPTSSMQRERSSSKLERPTSKVQRRSSAASDSARAKKPLWH